MKRLMFSAAMITLLTTCSADQREATQQDADMAAGACGVRLVHFGQFYRFDRDGLPNNAIWLDKMTQEAKACVEDYLSERNARAIVEHR